MSAFMSTTPIYTHAGPSALALACTLCTHARWCRVASLVAEPTYIFLAFILMAYILMAYIAMAFIVMAYILMPYKAVAIGRGTDLV